MSSRIDRRTALRRAAAPSLDFSLMPDAGALQHLLDAANQESGSTDSGRDAREALLRAANQGAPAAEASSTEAASTATAPAASTATAPERFRPAASPSEAPVPLEQAVEVPERFRMNPRHAGHPTLQPLEPPPAVGLRRQHATNSAPPEDADDVQLDPAVAFVRAHRGSGYERDRSHARRERGFSDEPTLILFGRDERPTQDLSEDGPQPTAAVPPGSPTPIRPEKRQPRAVAETFRPGRTAPTERGAPRPTAGVTLTPSGEEQVFWDSAPDEPVDEVPLWMDDGETSLAEDVDPELDAFLARRSRSRILTAVGILTVMGVLIAAAAAGLAVMAQPALLDGGTSAEVEAPLPPPPRPAPRR